MNHKNYIAEKILYIHSNAISLTQNPDFLEIPAVQQQRVFTEE
jgi:hypothetical protein